MNTDKSVMVQSGRRVRVVVDKRIGCFVPMPGISAGQYLIFGGGLASERASRQAGSYFRQDRSPQC